MCFITPAGFEGFFEEIGALTPLQQQEIRRSSDHSESAISAIANPPPFRYIIRHGG
jgi:hypothetical protein